MSGARGDEATMATGGGTAADNDPQPTHPLASFCLLASLLALILSAGYAVAPALSGPPVYLPLADPGAATPRIGVTRGAGDTATCAGPGCGGAAGGGILDPSAGAGSTMPGRSGGLIPPTVAAAAPAGLATAVPVSRVTPGVPAVTVTASVQTTLEIGSGRQVVSAPVPLVGSPLLSEVVAAYLRCWDGRAHAYAAADTAMLRAFLAEPALSEATGRIERLRAEGRVQRFEGGHAITVLAIEGDRAWLVDEYTVRVVAAPEPQPALAPTAAFGATPELVRTRTPAPEVSERVRVTFTIMRVDGIWKIADSVSTPVR